MSALEATCEVPLSSDLDITATGIMRTDIPLLLEARRNLFLVVRASAISRQLMSCHVGDVTSNKLAKGRRGWVDGDGDG